MVTPLTCVKYYLMLVLICISMIINNVEHLFTYMLAIYMFLKKCLFKVLSMTILGFRAKISCGSKWFHTLLSILVWPGIFLHGNLMFISVQGTTKLLGDISRDKASSLNLFIYSFSFQAIIFTFNVKFIYFLIKDNCFTELPWFLSNISMNQP